MKELYDDPKHVETTFDESKLHKYLLLAQKAEFAKLKKIIKEAHQRKKSPLTILDIGIGDARLLKNLVKEKEIWNMIQDYEGIDVAQNCIDISKKVIKNLNINNKAHVKLLDAVNLKKLNKKYDLIISTWFTVGNFYPSKFNFKKFKPGYDMTTNDRFTTIFKQAYALLNPNGELIIGSMYIDNNETRKKQEETYRHFGWTIITDKRDCFTATKEGWWSQRFTKQRIYDYLNFIPKKRIAFIPLDTYDYAMMARIKK
jgi:cyclopropane fatty-acyl-phospholipid synthase-like methyltransferase